MSLVRFDAVVSAVAWESGLDPDRNVQDKYLIQRWVNDSRREIYEQPIDWTALEYVGQFQSIANVTAGTVKASQNQAEVTGVGTAWASASNGQVIQIANGAWQRISYVTDTTHLTLETPWGDASVTGQTYTIWNRWYKLPPKARRVQEIVDTSNNTKPLAFFPPWEFYQKYGYGGTFSNPVSFTVFGEEDLANAYLGSTVFVSVSVTANSPIADFSGVQLSTAIAAGDRLVIGDSTTSTAFYVDRVLTDTKLALREFVPQTVSAASATAFSIGRSFVQMFPSPNSSSVVFIYKAYKDFADLVSPGDFLEDGWFPAVKKGAVAKACGYVRDPRETEKLAEYEREKANLIRAQYRAKNQAPRLKPDIQRRYGFMNNIFYSDRDTGY